MALSPKGVLQPFTTKGKLYFRVVLFFSFKDIIRGGKSMRSEMEHQLYVYQSLIFRSLLVDMSLIKGNAQNQVGE